MVSQRYDIGPLNKHGIYQIYSKYNWYQNTATQTWPRINTPGIACLVHLNIRTISINIPSLVQGLQPLGITHFLVAFSRLFCPSADTCGLSRKEMKPGAPGEANASYWLLLGTILNTMEYHAPWHWFCPPSSTTNGNPQILSTQLLFPLQGAAVTAVDVSSGLHPLWHSIPSGDVGHETHSSCQVATASASSGCSSATASSCRLWTSGIYCPMPLYNEYRCNSDKGQILECPPNNKSQVKPSPVASHLEIFLLHVEVSSNVVSPSHHSFQY